MFRGVRLSPLHEDFQKLGLEVPNSLGECCGDADLDEARVRVVKTKRSTASQRAEWRRAKRKNKAQTKRYLKKSSTQRRMKKLARAHAMKGDLGARKRLSLEHIEDQINALSKNIESISESVEYDGKLTQIRTFAEVARTSEALALNVGILSEDLDDPTLNDVYSTLTNLSQDCAEIAEGLDSGELPLQGRLEEAYRESVGYLLDGLDYYNSVLESLQFECKDDDEYEDEDGDGEEGDDDDDDY